MLTHSHKRTPCYDCGCWFAHTVLCEFAPADARRVAAHPGTQWWAWRFTAGRGLRLAR